MKVTVIGLGYIGLPTAATLAAKGIDVVGVDINQSVVDSINQGNINIVEPGLKELIHNSIKIGKFRATTLPEKANVFIVAVPTPLINNNKPDISYIHAACKAIAPVLEKGNLIILESTSPVGTSEKMLEWLNIEREDLMFPNPDSDLEADIAVAYCPERVLPGHILKELIGNDRIIGGVTTQCAAQAQNLYENFVKADYFVTDCRTAELCKLVENSFRDVNIAFANELSLICEKLNINVWNLIKLANCHPRVNILQPGPGVGGHCIAVDPWFIVDSAPDQAKLIRTARKVNDSKPEFILKKIEKSVKKVGKDKSNLTIACLGLTFKPDVDDLRESPALDIAKKVCKMNFNEIFIVEPNIIELPDCFVSNSVSLVSLNKAITSSDIIVLLVDHAQFKTMNLELISGKQVVDTRGSWS